METLKTSEFEKVFQRGKRFNDPLVRIRVAGRDEGGRGKVAFAAPKRLGNAVRRNRCKRVLREAARLGGLPAEHADVILFATDRTAQSSPSEVAASLVRLLAKAGVDRGL